MAQPQKDEGRQTALSPMDRFYVHSEEFWNGTRKWAVFERVYRDNVRWKRVSPFFTTERWAETRRNRMNADDARYQSAMLEKHYATRRQT